MVQTGITYSSTLIDISKTVFISNVAINNVNLEES